MDLPGAAESSPLIDRDRLTPHPAAAPGSPHRGRHFWSRLASQPNPRFARVRVLAFAALALLLGVVVLVNTMNLSPTTGIPEALLTVGSDANDPSNTAAAAAAGKSAPPPVRADASNCTVRWIEQKVDHFSWLAAPSADGTATDSGTAKENSSTGHGEPATYKQRYLVNDDYWDPSDKHAPVFFYTGNEGDVTLYANNTGLIWEHAQEFRALVVFAEHRYYGESFPFGKEYMSHLQYLNHEQAIADFLELIYFLQHEYNAQDHAVILFGGSYGGMLSAWFRMKYPSVVHGAIAASAPIFGFPAFPEFKGDQYWEIVTQAAQPAAGSSANCVPNVKKSWSKIFTLAKTDSGRAKLTELFRLCEPLTEEAQAEQVAMAVLVAFDTLAMGNFPYASSYLTNGAAELPPWPVKQACSHLDRKFADDGKDDDRLLESLRDAAFVFHNATKDLSCYPLPALVDFDGIWDYQWCTEMLPQETYFNSNGETDMFWPRNVTQAEITAHCQSTWGTTPDPDWIRVSYGDTSLRAATKIVFSNGKLDPWSSGGVHHVPEGSDLTILPIADGAHHIDLFFSHPGDTPSIKNARVIEIEHIRRWINEFVATIEDK